MPPRREPVPEADALEQATPVDDEEQPEPLTDDPEAPEADALEQREPAGVDEDEAPR
jgi:hypothetical protein